jgi:hypothetical protein
MVVIGSMDVVIYLKAHGMAVVVMIVMKIVMIQPNHGVDIMEMQPNHLELNLLDHMQLNVRMHLMHVMFIIHQKLQICMPSVGEDVIMSEHFFHVVIVVISNMHVMNPNIGLVMDSIIHIIIVHHMHVKLMMV